MNYSTIIDRMKKKGVSFASGLTEGEFDQIEAVYRVRLPLSFRGFYALGVPIDPAGEAGFPNWRDFSPENVAEIKARMDQPYVWLFHDIQRGFWLSEAWGRRPGSNVTTEELETWFRGAVANAPAMLPLYSHRYLVALAGEPNPPVLSTVGQDTICYGRDLEDYWMREFFPTDHSVPDCPRLTIPFWCDIILT